MEKYIPDLYQKSIYSINYEKLKNNGIKCLLFDLDNTLVPINIKKPTKRVKNLFKDLQEMGFKIIIFSNSPKSRLNTFNEELGVEYCARALKPLAKNFLKVMEKNRYSECEVAIIGDQFLTDIKGGNNVGITTILVNQVSKHDGFFTKINRIHEKTIINKLREKGLFTIGKYYE